MRILVYKKEVYEYKCTNCGDKVKFNKEKIDEIILNNNNINDKLNGIELMIDNMIKSSLLNTMNNQLKNVNIVLNNINDDIKKNNERLENLLDNIIIKDDNKMITGILDINTDDINKDIKLLYNKMNYNIDVYINNEKINIIKDKNNWKYNFKNEGKYTFKIIFNDIIANMYAFFELCSNITSLDFSYFDTSNITDMALMLSQCKRLKEIKGLNKFITNKVTDMKGMFQDCEEIEYLDLSNFDTSNVNDMHKMFNDCKKLKEIKGLNKFINNNVEDMSAMFQHCEKLEYLDLSNFDTSNVKDMNRMFNQCYKLKEIKGINSFNTNKVTDMKGMFQGCYELEYLDLSNFNTSNVTDMSYMFNKCNKLKYLNLLNFTINCETKNMLNFENKKNCQFNTNNKDLLNLYKSS